LIPPARIAAVLPARAFVLPARAVLRSAGCGS
jgi:hypothetical protein